MRLDCSTAEGLPDGEAGFTACRHPRGQNPPCAPRRLGAALLGPFRPPQSQRQSLRPSKPPAPPSFTARLPSPRLQQLQPQCPPCAVGASRVFPTRASSSWNSQPGTPLPAPPELAAHLVLTVSTPARFTIAQRPEASAPVSIPSPWLTFFSKGFIII